MDFRREEHHAGVGAPPQHRIVVAKPGEDAVGVGIEKALWRQIATRRKQAVGILKGAIDGRKRIVRS